MWPTLGDVFDSSCVKRNSKWQTEKHGDGGHMERREVQLITLRVLRQVEAAEEEKSVSWLGGVRGACVVTRSDECMRKKNNNG